MGRTSGRADTVNFSEHHLPTQSPKTHENGWGTKRATTRQFVKLQYYVEARSETPVCPCCRAQLAQQYSWSESSTPWPMIFTPQ